ncbi:FAD-dependent oxidoreductase [Nonomuraea sp. 10N515B]|uniref:FAD-dependent oxidoreductase n=1 Tax=Nonomuraea sp. 10N515B TaxID=3457422 RepID=UPI003FCC76D8
MNAHLQALADAEPTPFWLDDPDRPGALPALTGEQRCDLAVVGGGYSGLWTTLLAKERDPSLDVVVVEAREIGWAASGRKGGFCSASLTHGLDNGLARWPGEMETLERLGRDNLKRADHFFATFPQPEDLRFTHAWGGVIDTCSRFSVFFGTAYGGRVAYALGFTGLGVGATRFGAEVMLDKLSGKPIERTELSLVRSKPLPFPPDPARSLGIHLTQRALDRADRNAGRRGPWLRALDALGMGFGS